MPTGCKGSKMGSIWHPKLSENVPLWSSLPSNLPIDLPSNAAATLTTATFPKWVALEAFLGMNFVCHLLFLLCMYRSTH